MGYTHYFKNSKHFESTAWGNLCNDVRVVLSHLPKGVEVYGHHEGEPVVVNDLEIFLNGDCETLCLSAKPFEEFCKTNRRAYDITVSTILLLTSYHGPDTLSIGSDGLGENYADSEWIDAVALIHELFPTYGMDRLFQQLRVSSMLELQCESFMLHAEGVEVPKMYKIPVYRTVRSFVTVEVEATSEVEAKRKAIDIAPNLDFTGRTAESEYSTP